MAAVIERDDFGLAILKMNDCFGSSAHAGTEEFGKADLSDAAENGGNGEVVGNYQRVLLLINDRFYCPPGTLL